MYFKQYQIRQNFQEMQNSFFMNSKQAAMNKSYEHYRNQKYADDDQILIDLEKELKQQINESYTVEQKSRQHKKRKHRKFQEKYRAKDLANFDELQDNSDGQQIELEMNDKVEDISSKHQ